MPLLPWYLAAVSQKHQTAAAVIGCVARLILKTWLYTRIALAVDEISYGRVRDSYRWMNEGQL